MAARSMKIRVPVATLVEKAEACRQQIIDDHAAEVADYALAMVRWRAEVLVALDNASGRAVRGDLPEADSSYRKGYHLCVPINCAEPDRPSEEPSTRQVDRDLALLRAAADDTLLIGIDDNFGRYLT